MSFWEDSSPAVKGILVVGVLALVYLLVARFAGLVPFSCPNEGSCSGVLCLECEAPPETQQRGFRTENAVPPDETAEE